jgi:hypothetical protein
MTFQGNFKEITPKDLCELLPERPDTIASPTKIFFNSKRNELRQEHGSILPA